MKCLLFVLLTSVLVCSEADVLKRVHAHLLISDNRAALDECEKHLHVYPHSKELKREYFKALVKNGKDEEALSYFKTFEETDFSLVEALAWGVIKRFEQSPHFFVSQFALRSACSTQDVRGVEMLLRELKSSDARVRWTAVQLATHYRDRPLVQILEQMLFSEKVWFVRLEVIRALGAIGFQEGKEPLKALITHPRTTAEEKEVAMTSLVAIYDGVEDAELKECLTSSRSGLRQLGCEIIAHLNLKDKREMLELLLIDSCSEVRIAALRALSFLGLKTAAPSIFSKIAALMDDVNPSVSLTAAWTLSRYLPKESLQAVHKWLSGSQEEAQRLAAYVLGKMGVIGKELMEETIKTQLDPFVRVNLALGAIGQGPPDPRFADILYDFLSGMKQKVMWSATQNPSFVLIAPSKMTHIPQISKYPTIVDKMSRLELLGFLAVLKHPQALEMVKTFLKDDVFEVICTAALTLFEEGGADIFEMLTTLLREGEGNASIQAALILALSNREVEAVASLKRAYFSADRERKLQILAVLGQMGDQDSIPFLIQALEEPYQMVKVMAASALLQCAYH